MDVSLAMSPAQASCIGGMRPVHSARHILRNVLIDAPYPTIPIPLGALGKRKILMGKAERGRATRSPPLRSTEGFGLDEVKFLGYLPCLPRILLDQRLQRLNPGLQHRRVGGPPETALQSVDPSAPSDCLSSADPDIA